MSSIPKTNFVSKFEPAADARVELKNGRFLDVMGGTYFNPSVSVVIRSGRIESMPGLPGESSDAKPDFTIDLMGKTVLPGLFNTHCHINMISTTLNPTLTDIRLVKKYSEQQKVKNMADCLAHGITNVRDAHSGDLRLSWALRERISRGEIPGPRFIQSVAVGPPGSYLAEKYGLAMRIMVYALMGITKIDYSRIEAGTVEFPIDATERQVRDAVDRAIDERGAECIKIGEQRENMTNFKPNLTIMTTNQLQALADQARRRGVQSMMHHVSVESFRRGVKAGVTSLSHVPRDAPLTEEDVEAFNAAGCIIEPTVSARYSIHWKIRGDPSYDDPLMNRLTEYRDKIYTYEALANEYYVPELRQGVINSYNMMSRGKFKILGVLNRVRFYRYYAAGITHGSNNYRLISRHNACIALANDGGIPPLTPAMMQFELDFMNFLLSDELGSRQMAGTDAVQIATINSARSMGLEKDFGSIETGKIADLVIVNGNPLEDYRILGSHAAALFMNGKLVIDNCGLEVKATSAA